MSRPVFLVTYWSLGNGVKSHAPSDQDRHFFPRTLAEQIYFKTSKLIVLRLLVLRLQTPLSLTTTMKPIKKGSDTLRAAVNALEVPILESSVTGAVSGPRSVVAFVTRFCICENPPINLLKESVRFACRRGRA